MTSPSTPGPGGFGPSPAFGQVARAGVKLAPAQTRPRPGVYSGPAAVAYLFRRISYRIVA